MGSWGRCRRCAVARKWRIQSWVAADFRLMVGWSEGSNCYLHCRQKAEPLFAPNHTPPWLPQRLQSGHAWLGSGGSEA